MDAYPEDYVNHNLPLILLSGLGADAEDDAGSLLETTYPLFDEKGYKIFSDFPPLSGGLAEELRRVLLEADSSRMSWRSTASPSGSLSLPYTSYKIKSTGRVSLQYTIPRIG